jgi:hypothetical protein
MKVENKINKILMTLASVLIFGATMVNAKVETAEFGLLTMDYNEQANSPVLLDNTLEKQQMRTGEMAARLSKHLSQVPIPPNDYPSFKLI